MARQLPSFGDLRRLGSYACLYALSQVCSSHGMPKANGRN